MAGQKNKIANLLKENAKLWLAICPKQSIYSTPVKISEFIHTKELETLKETPLHKKTLDACRQPQGEKIIEQRFHWNNSEKRHKY